MLFSEYKRQALKNCDDLNTARDFDSILAHLDFIIKNEVSDTDEIDDDRAIMWLQVGIY